MNTTAEPEHHAIDAVRNAGVGRPLRDAPSPIASQAWTSDNAGLFMQTNLGNRATRWIPGAGIPQRKLIVGAPDDAYEKEADGVAEQVTARTPLAAAGTSGSDDDHPESLGLARNSAKQRSAQRILQRVPVPALQRTLGNRAFTQLLREALSEPEIPQLSRKCACGGYTKEGCAECRENKQALQRGSDSPDVAGSEPPPVVEKVLATPGRPPENIQRLTWDDVTGAVSDAKQAAVQDAEAVGSAVSSGAQAAAGTVAGVVGNAALDAANSLAGLLGGTVTVKPSGAIVITIPDKQIAEVEDETFVLPLGIPTEPIFEAGFKVGSFTMLAYAGTVYGDPAATIAIGPVRLQNIALTLDPGAGTYAGTAQLYIGSAVSGSVEKATEARVQAQGVIPMEPPIPVVGSGEVGIRTILRLVGKEGFQDTVTVGYSGGSFILHRAFDVKLGGVAERAREAFLRVEIEGEEVCSVIWPMGPPSRAETGIEIRVPVTVNTGGSDLVTMGSPKTNPISPNDIPTDLQDNHEPEKCMELKEFIEFLCRKGKVPPELCPALGPGGSVHPVTPPVGPSVGPVPVLPPKPGGGGGGKRRLGTASEPCTDPLPIDWPEELPVPRGGPPLRRNRNGDSENEWDGDERGAAQREMQAEIKRRRDRCRDEGKCEPPPQPCSDEDDDPNAVYDAHHIHPMYLGGKDRESNLCSCETDRHRKGHRKLDSQKDRAKSDPTWHNCGVTEPRLSKHPTNQQYDIE